MITIHKFSFKIDTHDIIPIVMPLDAKILSFQMQDNTPCIWALVDDTEDRVVRNFRVFGTGHPVEGVHLRDYIGTAKEGCFVWHLFERKMRGV